MCGFLAEYTIQNNLTTKNEFISLLHLSQKRGPDYQGYWTNNKNIQLGFNRLAIIDLSEAGRQIQIEYIKRRNPKVAKIEWQQHRPFNLYNYHLNKVPYNLPYRVYGKLSRIINPKKFIQRNWELQFLGKQNEEHLEAYLFQNEKMHEIVPKEVVASIYKKFQQEDAVYYSHSLSMLLTLSLFFSNIERHP